MRSSISSSDRQVPAGPWGRTWIAALAAASAALGAVEWQARSQGLSPSLEDSPEAWAEARARAAGVGPSGVVLVGTSRFQIGLVPEVMEGELEGCRVVQLAIYGGGGLPVLEDLANDADVNGVILVEVYPQEFFGRSADRLGLRSQSWIRVYRKRGAGSPAARWEGVLRHQVQARAALTLPQMHLTNLLGGVRREGGGVSGRILPSRRWLVDFGSTDLEAAEQRLASSVRGVEPLPSVELAERLQRLRGWVDRVEARGGRVVFFRMIASGAVRAAEEERFPAEGAWGRLMSAFPDRCLSFEDVPALASYRCAEGAHLRTEDGEGFTRTLARELVRRNLVGRAGGR